MGVVLAAIDPRKAPGMNRSPLLNTGHVRLKECRHGPMLYLVTDHYIGQSLDRYGEFSQGEAELFCRLVQPGWTVLEVGANIGAHTVPLAKVAGPGGAVHAVEPQRVIFQILSANVALNALSNVHTYHAAMGRLASTIAVPRLNYAAANNFGGLSLEHALEGERVPLIPADSLDLPRCELIKIDVEGMEGEVIAGAVRTIRRFRPVLYVENDRVEKSAALIRQLFALDYRLYWHFPPLFNPQNYFGDAENVFAGTVSINMLGVHASSPLSVAGFREITDPEESWRTAVSAMGAARSVPPDAGGGVVMVGLLPSQERAAASADELNQAGIRLAQQGRLEEALLSFRRALQIQPGLAQSHNNLGIALQDQGRLEEAVASYQRALALKPDYAVAYNNLGTALKEQRKLDEAAACFRACLATEARRPDGLLEPGRHLARAGSACGGGRLLPSDLGTEARLCRGVCRLGRRAARVKPPGRSRGLLPPGAGIEAGPRRRMVQPGRCSAGSGPPGRSGRLPAASPGAEARLGRVARQPGHRSDGTGAVRRSAGLLPSGRGDQARLGRSPE